MKRKARRGNKRAREVALVPIDSDPGDRRDPKANTILFEGEEVVETAVEPAKKKRKFGEELHEKVDSIQNEVASLGELADNHHLGPYLSDLVSQFTKLSAEVKKRLDDLSHLDRFLKAHCGSACANVNCSYFSVLPPELNIHILSFLSASELLEVSLVNKEWNRYAMDESLWKQLCDYRWRELRNSDDRHKRARKSWRAVFAYRMKVDENWNRGQFSRVVTLRGHESQVCCCQYDEQKIVSGSFDSSIKVWDMKKLDSKKEITPIMTLKKTEHNDAHTDRVLCLMFQGDQLVTGGRDETVKIWDLATGACLNTLTGHTDNVWYLQFDDNKIVSGSADKSICFWDIRTGKCYNTLVGHERGLSCLHFEDNILMSGSADKTIKVWDLRTNTCRLTLTGHTEAVYCLYYYNNKLITGGEDTTAKVWDLDTGRCKSTISGENCKDKHKGAIYCMQFDDRRLVTGSFDHTIKVWDVNTERCLHTFCKATSMKEGDYHECTVRRIQFDDFKIVSASADRTIKVWTLS